MKNLEASLGVLGSGNGVPAAMASPDTTRAAVEEAVRATQEELTTTQNELLKAQHRGVGLNAELAVRTKTATQQTTDDKTVQDLRP